MKKSIIAIVMACLLSTSVQAAIIDNGDYFKDDATGYTWMDLTTFVGFTYEDVEAQIQGTGFQIATLPLLQQLWESTYQYTFSYLHAVMGGSSGSSTLVSMFDNEIDDNFAGLAWSRYYAERISWYLESNYHAYNSEEYNIFESNIYGWGTWVVKTSFDNIGSNFNTVPEPNTLLLLGAGLIGLAALRRTRRS